ncbi:MAG: DUF882 domain-containing protein [Geobacter sp.]|nr:MAG: DUF882 domain-containing protein [Geobacter sp.]
MLSRRSFIKTLAIAAAAVSSPTLALGFEYGADGAPLPHYDDKDLLELRPAQQPRFVEGLINLRSGFTGERFQCHFRDPQGNYNAEHLQYLNWFMRCNYDHQYTRMDIRVVEMLNYLAKWFPGNPEITINSAYRTPRYNRILARSNENVAKNSLHMQGQALDFSVQAIPIRSVCQVAQAVRNMVGAGGVGFYPSQNFVHIDCGQRAATWVR